MVFALVHAVRQERRDQAASTTASRAATVELEIVTRAARRAIAASYGRFHAKWHRDAFLPDGAGAAHDRLDDAQDRGPRAVPRRDAARLESRAAAGGARATRSSSSTARSSPPPSAPARRTTSATPGAARRSSRTPTTTRPSRWATRATSASTAGTSPTTSRSRSRSRAPSRSTIPNTAPDALRQHGLLVSGAGRQGSLSGRCRWPSASATGRADRQLHGQGRARRRAAEGPRQDRRQPARAGPERPSTATGATTRSSGGPSAKPGDKLDLALPVQEGRQVQAHRAS